MNNNLIIIFLLILTISCSRNNEVENNNNDEAPNVGIQIAQKEAYEHTLDFTGSIKPYREANIGSAIPGRIEKLHYSEGDRVKKGSLIAQLSGETAAMARYEYETLQKDYERSARLRERGTATQQDYDHIKGKYKAAEARHEFFKNNSEIRAPFSGMIVEHLVNEGETFSFSPGLEPGYSHASGIARLMQLNPAKVKIDVSENLIPELHKNIETVIKTDVYPDEIFEGEISFIRPILSTSSRTATVEITVDNPENKLMPGMYAKVSLEMDKDSLVFVPRHAITDRQEGKGNLWLIKDGHAIQQQTTIIDEHDGKMALKGIQEGDSIVVSGLHALMENMKVRVRE